MILTTKKVNDETVNFVLHISNNSLSVEDFDFARYVLEELIFNTHQSMGRKEKENILLVGTGSQFITLPKILFLRVVNIIKQRRESKKLAFKKEGTKNENGRIG